MLNLMGFVNKDFDQKKEWLIAIIHVYIKYYPELQNVLDRLNSDQINDFYLDNLYQIILKIEDIKLAKIKQHKMQKFEMQITNKQNFEDSAKQDADKLLDQILHL